jgi:CheY-like chemotaxis protein
MPSSVRVLVVDDDMDNRESMAELLSLWGYGVRMAPDGLAALEAVGEWHPDVALMDLSMPRMDGFQAAQRIRAGFPAVLLVALSGFASGPRLARAYECGFRHVLSKPCDTQLLREILAGVIAAKKASRIG